MAHKTPQGTWRARWVDADGRRRSECFRTKIQAIQREMKSREIDTGPEPSKETFAEFSGDWLAKHAEVHMAPGSVKELRSIISTHLVPAFGEVPIKSLTKIHLLSLQSTLAKRMKPKTANNIVALAKSILVTATEWEKIPMSPFKSVDMLKVGDQSFDFWRPEERDYFARMARQHDPEFASAVVVACHTGLRRGELVGLRRYHLDFEKRLIEVSQAFCFKTYAVGATKNRTREFMPMSQACYQALKEKQLLPPDAPVFRREMFQNAARDLRRIAERIGARPIRWHDLRHTFASCLVMAGVPLYTVQKLMRHKTPLMTQRYAHLSPGYLQEAIEAIAPKNDCPDFAPIQLSSLARP